ncbi:hypothetical protein P280DRAFT_466838 [Massarina eburnea CBS 473.64]|uniref:2EXR domain-containing protein n=1 Tax=Massarina eburnea CBS 473.64 TaxID=1395130 RepID=A0A6A6SAA8_9PLEO|nr:hypothetical protein P280DRAFT_466838 [Massarina eburnea CBS 473.64]
MATVSQPSWKSQSQSPWLEHDAPKAEESDEKHTSDSPIHFEFLNDSFTRSSESQASFHLFPNLPLELRRHIWSFSLPQHRLLKVTVAAAEPDYDSAHQSRDDASKDPCIAPYQEKNDLGNVVSGADYHLRLCSTSTNSPLLYVNHEANEAVHDVHRVHVPMSQRSDAPRLRFCPERDTILIAVETDEDKAYFADFVHDALAYDPKKRGILHIAIRSQGCPSKIHLPIELSKLHNSAQAALVYTLKHLESVSLVHLFRTKSRQMFSSLELHYIRNRIPQTEVVRLNRAYPLWSSTASYSILPVDPRPVSRYLDLVDLGWDPCGLIRAWHTLEAAYDVSPVSSDKIRVLIAAAEKDEVLDIATTSQARSFRQQEEQLWNRDWAEGGLFNLHHPDMAKPDDDESREFMTTQNAIGFWSVPLEAFGPVPEVPYDTSRWWYSKLCDLTGFESQIELGLFEVA